MRFVVFLLLSALAARGATIPGTTTSVSTGLNFPSRPGFETVYKISGAAPASQK
jgi:hypothetical protein